MPPGSQLVLVLLTTPAHDSGRNGVVLGALVGGLPLTIATICLEAYPCFGMATLGYVPTSAIGVHGLASASGIIVSIELILMLVLREVSGRSSDADALRLYRLAGAVASTLVISFGVAVVRQIL